MTWRTLLAFSLLCVCWGVPYFFIKLAVPELSPAVIAWGRITLGAAVLLPIAARRGALAPAWSHRGALLAFAVAELVIPFSLIAESERHLSSSLAGLLVAATPLTILSIAPLFGVRETLTVRRGFGLLLGFAGVAALLGVNPIEGTGQWLALGCMALAVIGYAVGPLVVQKHLAGVDPLGSLAASLAAASLLLLPVAAASLPAAIPSPTALLSVAVLGLVSTAGAMLLYFHVIAAAGAARASVVAYISPAIAAVLGVTLLHEPFTLGMGAALLLIFAGSALGTERRG